MQQNSEYQGMAAGAAVLGAVAIISSALIFAAALFLSIICTVACVTAWKRPQQFFGQTVTPEKARAFVHRGLLGAILLPGLALFCFLLFGVAVRSDYWIYLPLGGYAFGSLVVTYHIEKAKLGAKQQAAEIQALLPPDPARPVRTIETRPSAMPVADEQPEPQPFRFATWDDEEELRK